MFCMIFPYKCSLFNTLSMYKVSMPCLFSFSRYQTKCVIKGGLGSDDLTILNCFRVIFSLKMKTIQFSLSFNLYFQQKRAPKLAICHLSTKRSVRVFDIINRRNDFTSFQSYNQVVMYSLTHQPKAIRYFENILKPLTEIIFLSQHLFSILNTKQTMVFFRTRLGKILI